MDIHARGGRTIRTLLLLAGLCCVTGWAQTASKTPPRLQYDIRRYPAVTQSATGAGSESKIAAPKRVAASPGAGQPGGSLTSLVRRNSFGLPKAVLHRGGVPAVGAQGDPLALAKDYLRSQSALFPFSETDIANLRTSAAGRFGGLTFLTLNQTVNGVPVFGGHVRVVLDGAGAVVQSGVDEVIPRFTLDTRPRLTPEEAVRKALQWLGAEPAAGPLAALPSQRAGRGVFAHPGSRSFRPIVAELSVFPMTPVSARLAYRVFASAERGHYELLLDANDGQVLYAADLQREAGQARVWPESPAKGPRELLDLHDSWLPPGTTVTTGNNADVYLDWDGDDEPDPFDFGGLNQGRAFSASSVFDFPAGEGSTGQDPTEFSASAVTNAFYFVNQAHDYFYELGFTEEAGNFQADNQARGGLGNDAVVTHVQDGNVGSNARFLGAPEGMSPRMELGISAQGTVFNYDDDRDYALDGEVVIHEYSHGVTSRLVGGPDSVSCLFGTQSAALGEGWSDYFGISYFDDPVLGEYSSGNAERGMRRFGYDRHPLTYEDLGNEGFEVHADGEIWAATLWDVRQALGADTTDQLVMNALRMTPCWPSMIDARDAILDADQIAYNGSHHDVLWTVFAGRGMGRSAGGYDGTFLESNVFNAAYDLPPDDAEQNSGPTVTSWPRDLAAIGQQYVYSVVATDADGDTLGYELLEGPPGTEVNATGRVTTTPNSLVPIRAKVAVSDGKGGRVIHGFTIPVFPILSDGRSVTIDGPAFREGYAGFFVEDAAPLVQVTLRGGMGDADLVVFGPDGSMAESFRLGSDETITIADPALGPWLIMVTSREDYSAVRLAVNYPKAAELAANSRNVNLRGAESSETFYQFSVPEGAASFTVSTGCGSGDVDLFLARERYPICQISLLTSVGCDFDERSFHDGNFESITVNDSNAALTAARPSIGEQAVAARLSAAETVTVRAVEAGQWFLNLAGFDDYEGLTLTLTVDVEGSAAPAISTGGVVHAASFAPRLGAGGIATLFGANLAAETAQSDSVPLPRELGGVRVLVGGVEAPLFYVSPGQINFQTPFETAEGMTGVMVERDGVPSALTPTLVMRNSPGIFTYPRTPEVADPVVVHADGSVVSPRNPARPGETVVVFATGVGELTNPPSTGEPSPADPLAVSAVEPAVMVGNVPATVLFAGLTPNFVGLLQINVRLPDVLPAGGALGLMVSFGDSASPPVVLAME